MNVIHLITNLNPMGGAERLVADLCKRAIRFKPFVLAIYGANGQLVDELYDAGVPVGSVRGRFDIRGLRRCASEWGLRPEHTVFHVHLFPSLYMGAVQRGYPCIYTEHSTDNRRRHIPLLRPVERAIYRRYDAVTAISSAAAAELHNWIGTSCQVSVIENGIDLARFSQCASKAREGRRGSERFVIGMTGRMSAAKNQDVLIEAIAGLPERFHLRLAGDGARRSHLEDLARRLRVQDRVEFLGYVRDVRTFLGDLDLYVQASHYEGFGLAPLEAMSAGLPVIGSRVPGLMDVLGCEDCLFDPDHLVPLIHRIASDPSFREYLCAHGMEQARRFSIEATVRRYEDLYSRVLGNANAAA